MDGWLISTKCDKTHSKDFIKSNEQKTYFNNVTPEWTYSSSSFPLILSFNFALCSSAHYDLSACSRHGTEVAATAASLSHYQCKCLKLFVLQGTVLIKWRHYNWQNSSGEKIFCFKSTPPTNRRERIKSDVK